jgi:KUP system potassium uptake protein
MATIRIADKPHPKEQSNNDGPALAQLPSFTKSRSWSIIDSGRNHDDIYNIRSRSRSQRRRRSADGVGLGLTVPINGEDGDPGLRRAGDYKQKQVKFFYIPSFIYFYGMLIITGSCLVGF